MMKEMTFLGWALTQAHRQDAIGDIARRIQADPHFPGSQASTSAQGILRRATAYLASMDASDAVLKMLVTAVDEYDMRRNNLLLMTTFILELPDALAKQLQALPAEKVSSVHAAALIAIEEQIQALEAGQWTPTPVDSSHLSDEEAGTIRERLVALADGRAVAIPGDVLLAQVWTMTKEE